MAALSSARNRAPFDSAVAGPAMDARVLADLGLGQETSPLVEPQLKLERADVG